MRVQLAEVRAIEEMDKLMDAPLTVDAPDWSGDADGWGEAQIAKQVCHTCRSQSPRSHL